MLKIEARDKLLSLIPHGATIAEIGVWKGDFSQCILEKTDAQLLYLIDPWELNTDPAYRQAWYGLERGEDMESIYESVKMRFRSHIRDGVVRMIRGDSGLARSQIEARSIDAIYIDGDHTYQSVVRDLEFARYAIKKGGLICGDDYVLDRWWERGVVRAVNEFIGQDECVIEYLEDGQFVLRMV